nr:immunoglobulin heavy chain junction region [Mus musculus]NSM09643.1 immunoglobulin heavy chain junction region [Mus musculus]
CARRPNWDAGWYFDVW